MTSRFKQAARWTVGYSDDQPETISSGDYLRQMGDDPKGKVSEFSLPLYAFVDSADIFLSHRVPPGKSLCPVPVSVLDLAAQLQLHLAHRRCVNLFHRLISQAEGA
jgi:hypothetical protein